MAYPANYAVDPAFKHDAEMRQSLPLPTLLTQQAVLALGNWHVPNTIAFWNLMNCIVDTSCPTVNTSPATGPTRIQTLFQQIFNNQQADDQQTIFQTLAQQIGSLLPNQVVQEGVIRNIHALAYQYPEYFAGRFEFA